MEPEERFKNIRKAEWLFWLSRSVPIFLITGMQWGQMLSWNFKNLIFSDLMLLTLLFIAFTSIQMLCEGICLLFWSYTRGNMLKSGKIPAYVRKGRGNLRVLLLLEYFLFIGFLAYHQEQIFLPLLLPAAAVVVLLLFTGAGIALWRPSRADNWILQLVSAGIIFCIGITLTFAVIFSSPDSDNTSNDIETFPLVQADYRQMDGEISSANEDHIEGILGRADCFDISYYKKDLKDISSDAPIETDSLRYTIYQSPHSWILDKLWNDEMPDPKEHPQERTEAWNALSAVSVGGTDRIYKELVRYPGNLLVLYSDEKLTDPQIEIIREKLGIAEK